MTVKFIRKIYFSIIFLYLFVIYCFIKLFRGFLNYQEYKDRSTNPFNKETGSVCTEGSRSTLNRYGSPSQGRFMSILGKETTTL